MVESTQAYHPLKRYITKKNYEVEAVVRDKNCLHL